MRKKIAHMKKIKAHALHVNHVRVRKNKTASMLVHIDSPGLWNSAGAMNSVLPKHFPSVGVLMLVVKSSVHHVA